MKLPTTLRTLMHSVGCLRGGKIPPLIVPSGTGTSENPFRPLRTVPERLEYRQIRTGTEEKRATPAPVNKLLITFERFLHERFLLIVLLDKINGLQCFDT